MDPFIEFSSSSRNTKLKDIHAWEISQMILKTLRPSQLAQ